ncbi:hypothetical protein FIBSPDRAFT_778584 [Athelia psychrophila]|uniref:Uncharacterized protein n=1 Tax=Athelia psychrophila TaxID=1759441 RepID=A0A166SAH2_9AGAM|nr:hypothetical protein FIBSPDRAFT_778584 [Fibularhizoctonia sp. CBS 109695]
MHTYQMTILDEGMGRLLAVFASRAIADEWWRAVSTSAYAHFIDRVAPQLYTHDAVQCNLGGFFDMPQFKPIADRFRGRMFFTMLNDRSGLDITMIPPQEINDHVSGGWYHIRSVSNHALGWRYDATKNEFQLSNVAREHIRLQVNIRTGVPAGTIMVGEDQITLHISPQLHIYAEKSGQLKARPELPGDFRFLELESGNFATSELDSTVVFVDNADYSADSTVTLRSWELVPALSPTSRKMIPEAFIAENELPNITAGHSSAEHSKEPPKYIASTAARPGNLNTVGSAGIGFDRNTYGMYFFIRLKGTDKYLSPKNNSNTEGVQLEVCPRTVNNNRVLPSSWTVMARCITPTVALRLTL